MNGFERKGLALLSLLTLSGYGPVRAEQPPVAPNESACIREKLSNAIAELEFRVSELPYRLASHQCDGERCYVVEDQPNCGETTGTTGSVPLLASEDADVILQSNAAPPLVSSPLGRSLQDARLFGKAGHLPQPAPVAALPQITHDRELMELRVLNSELVARLEMTQAILELQNHYTEQILSLERDNARLVAEATELRVKNEVNEQLTVGLIERTELNARLTAAHDWISSRTAYEASLPVQLHPTALGVNSNWNSEETIAAIQEDLSNLRRQLSLLKRTPVPFAVSNTVSHEHPYVPLVSKAEANSTSNPCPSDEETDSPCREAAIQRAGPR